MPRYFFHMKSMTQRVDDPKGREMNSLRAAHTHAVYLIARAAKHLTPQDVEGWTIRISNGDGRVELTVLFPTTRHRIWQSFNTGAAARRATVREKLRSRPGPGPQY